VGGEAGATSGPYVQVASGLAPFVCALTEDGDPTCWGAADYFLQGPDPALLPLTSIAATQHQVCAVTVQRRIGCFRVAHNVFEAGPTGLYGMTEYAEVDTGFRTTSGARILCGLTLSGNVLCGGPSVEPEPPVVGTFTQVSNWQTGCAVAETGELACWPWGDPDQVELTAAAPSGSFRQVSVADSYACALDEVGGVVCWGDDEHGAASPPEGEFESITTAPRHACGVRPGGSVECWGDDEFGQSSPPDEPFSQVSARWGEFTCGLTPEGWIRCWGDTSSWVTVPPGG
jgi:hypothetical protein